MDSGLQTQRSVQVLVGQWSANMTTYSVACWTVVYRHDNTLNCLLYSGLQTWRHILWLVGQLSTDMTRSFACWTVVYKHDDTFSGLLYSCLQTWQVQSACFRVVYKNDNTFSCLFRGGGDSSVVRAPDSWLKSRGFESLLERRENFLLQGRLSVLTLISVSVPPPCYHSST